MWVNLDLSTYVAVELTKVMLIQWYNCIKPNLLEGLNILLQSEKKNTANSIPSLGKSLCYKSFPHFGLFDFLWSPAIDEGCSFSVWNSNNWEIFFANFQISLLQGEHWFYSQLQVNDPHRKIHILCHLYLLAS